MPETDYLKVPADRVGVLIGTKGETKKILLVFGKQIISLKLLHVDSILILHLN